MRRPASLTLRLTLLFGFAAGIVLSGFGVVIERSIDHHFRSEDAAELRSIADAVSAALSARGGINDPTSLERRFGDTLVGHHGAVLYVTGRDGEILFASPGEPDLSTLPRSASETVRTWSDAAHSYRLLTRLVRPEAGPPRGPYTVAVAVTIDSHLHFFENFNRTLWAMIASGIAMTALMGWFAVRQGHAPLRSIVERIHRISAEELNTRLRPETYPRELTDLAESFNAMLERMDRSFQQLSNFSADIAHELRTPVTSLLTQTQVALSQSRTVDEYREILYSNMEEYEHMAQMIGDMLFLAKADSRLFEAGNAEIDLAAEVRDLFEYYGPWAEEQQVALECAGNARVSGDRLMLRRAIGNLLSNAIKHTPSGATVKVQLGSDDQAATIAVENPGKTIPAEHIPRLFDRFFRRDNALHRGNEGAGLGLAIAKAIVEMHRGKIEASSTAAGTVFRITLPRPVPGAAQTAA